MVRGASRCILYAATTIDSLGAAMRSTFVLNARGIVTDIIRSEEILVARQFEDYLTALSN